MTTSDKASWNVSDKDFQKLFQQLGVDQALDDAAARIQRMIRAGWPKSIGNQTARDTDKFQHHTQREVFSVEKATHRDGRPVRILMINHPYAVAHQARTGGITKGIKAAGFELNQQGGG